MATRATIQTKVTARTTGGSNTVSTERDLWTEFLNNDYATPTLQNPTTATLIQRVNTGLTHAIYLAKSGNKVSFFGTFSIASGNILINTNMFTFPSTEFRPRTGIDQYINCVELATYINFPLVLNATSTGQVLPTKTIVPTSLYVVSGEYYTND